jgi:hypothetical protein
MNKCSMRSEMGASGSANAWLGAQSVSTQTDDVIANEWLGAQSDSTKIDVTTQTDDVSANNTCQVCSQTDIRTKTTTCVAVVAYYWTLSRGEASNCGGPRDLIRHCKPLVSNA